MASESDHITIVAVPEGILDYRGEDDTKEQCPCYTIEM